MVETKTRVTREEGFKKGFLKHKKVWLKPIPEKKLTLITGGNTVHSFTYDGATYEWCLPQNANLDYFNPFDSEEEQHYFEDLLGKDLSTNRGPLCFWNSENAESVVSIIVDASIRSIGYELNMESPNDVIRYKILKKQHDIAPSWEKRNDRMHYKWMLVDSDVEDTTKKKEADLAIDAYTFFGTIKESKEKMSDFLTLYFMNNKEYKEVSEDTTTAVLMSQVQNIVQKDIAGFLETSTDPNREQKTLIIKGLKIGAIEKHGVNSYSFPSGIKYTLKEFVEILDSYKENQDEEYLKLIARLDVHSNKKLSNK
jgi:hypothetical protein